MNQCLELRLGVNIPAARSFNTSVLIILNGTFKSRSLLCTPVPNLAGLTRPSSSQRPSAAICTRTTQSAAEPVTKSVTIAEEMRPLALTAFALALGIGIAQAQTAAVPEPEFNDVFYRLDTGKLIPLERQAVQAKGHASGFIVMSMKTSALIPGGKSPVRFRASTPQEFIVKSLLGSYADPNTMLWLRKLTPKKDKRELVIMSGHASPVSTSVNTNMAAGTIPMEFSHFGQSSLKATVTLPPGEYALSLMSGQFVFCFGID